MKKLLIGLTFLVSMTCFAGLNDAYKTKLTTYTQDGCVVAFRSPYSLLKQVDLAKCNTESNPFIVNRDGDLSVLVTRSHSDSKSELKNFGKDVCDLMGHAGIELIEVGDMISCIPYESNCVTLDRRGEMEFEVEAKGNYNYNKVTDKGHYDGRYLVKTLKCID